MCEDDTVKKKGRSGKLAPHNKIAEHEQMNVWLCNVPMLWSLEGNCSSSVIVGDQLFKLCPFIALQRLASMRPPHLPRVLLLINDADS